MGSHIFGIFGIRKFRRVLVQNVNVRRRRKSFCSKLPSGMSNFSFDESICIEKRFRVTTFSALGQSYHPPLSEMPQRTFCCKCLLLRGW